MAPRTRARVDVIIGAKSRDMLIYVEKMRAEADNLYIATDDGSEGTKGLVTQVVERLVGEEGSTTTSAWPSGR